MNAQNHVKKQTNKRTTEVPNHKKETCSSILFFNLQLPPHYLTHSAGSQPGATCHLEENQVHTQITSNHTYHNRKAQVYPASLYHLIPVCKQ